MGTCTVCAEVVDGNGDCACDDECEVCGYTLRGCECDEWAYGVA